LEPLFASDILAFLLRDAMIARYIQSSCVCACVCHTPVLCQNG